MALTAEISRTSKDSDLKFVYALVASLLIHFTVVLYLNQTNSSASVPEEKLMEVTLEPVIEKPVTPLQNHPIQVPPIPKQMVTPPDVPEAPKPPENTNFLSDKNTIVPKEQIKRGDGGEKSPEPKPKTEQNKPEPTKHELIKKDSPKQPQKNNETATNDKPLENKEPNKKKILNLTLDPESLNELAEKPHESKSDLRNLSRYQPFSNNDSAKNDSSTAELFRFRPGSSDFLPNIQDGEVTMLNAKADKFAPFVRRVAGQVFGIVRKLQWHNIPSSDVMRITEFTTIEAVLSPKGQLLRVNLQSGSGSASFDKVISQSVKDGANDQNPPTGVEAEDGNIHFIFKSRCWTRQGAAGIPDSRWLLLATGLL